jgi:heptosyltransferase-2
LGQISQLAATVPQTKSVLPCQRTVCIMNDHRCVRDIEASDVADIAQRVMTQSSVR